MAGQVLWAQASVPGEGRWTKMHELQAGQVGSRGPRPGPGPGMWQAGCGCGLIWWCGCPSAPGLAVSLRGLPVPLQRRPRQRCSHEHHKQQHLHLQLRLSSGPWGQLPSLPLPRQRPPRRLQTLPPPPAPRRRQPPVTQQLPHPAQYPQQAAPPTIWFAVRCCQLRRDLSGRQVQQQQQAPVCPPLRPVTPWQWTQMPRQCHCRCPPPGLQLRL